MIKLKDVTFQYENTSEGLSNINLSVNKGECVVFIGPSGNGKTTLTRLINGLAPVFYKGKLTGDLYIDNKNMASFPFWQRGKIVGSVFQNPKSQFFSSEMVGEVAFGCENYGLSYKEICKNTNNAIEKFDISNLKDKSLDVLSSGEKQKVAIASVYALKPKVYVCDEPTANLDEKGIEELKKKFIQLKEEGNTLIIAEHRISWLMSIADRFVYLEKGNIKWYKTLEQMKELSEDELNNYGIRSSKNVLCPKLSKPLGSDIPILEIDNLTVKRSKNYILNKISFKAWAGQIIAITGQNGAGKTTFGKSISYLCKSKGSIKINGNQKRRFHKDRSIWYGSNDMDAQFFTDSVSEEILVGLDRTNDIIEKARLLLKEFGLYKFKDLHPTVLSGGQKQRLSIACGLLSERKILILDEPTSGLDKGNMLIIANAIKKASLTGKTILVITHDYEFIKYCCNYMFKF